MIPRIGNWRPKSALALMEALVKLGWWAPNPVEGVIIGRDHWLTCRALATRGVPHPLTLVGSDPQTLTDSWSEIGGYPAVVKCRNSRMGSGVILCRGRDHLEAVLESLWRLGTEYVVQEYVPGAEQTLRVILTAGEPVAWAKHTAREGEWRSNASRGGRVAPCPRNEEALQVAAKAAEACKLGFCGVDLAFCRKRGLWLVLDVNPTPGMANIQAALGWDVSAAVLGRLERAFSSQPNQNRPAPVR